MIPTHTETLSFRSEYVAIAPDMYAIAFSRVFISTRLGSKIKIV